MLNFEECYYIAVDYAIFAIFFILPMVLKMMMHDHMRTFYQKSFRFDEKYDVANYDEDDDTSTT